ncbi:MAG: SusC/RagA family TonB-linked outer membrane protein [Bacteroidales bacterium]|nr:SusC/RagA family TonB-linked outer membrane protein [Bacteroidales bacterium]
MRKVTMLLLFLLFVGLNFALAQTRTISGTVTSSDDGKPLPGVTVQLKGTTVGTTTDFNGKYSLNVDLKQGNVLVFSFVGMATQEISIGNSNTINVVMKSSAMAINEVVVTALGISREKKSLGYATQNVSGAELDVAKPDNMINSLSGRVSGVTIRNSGNMGGSSNILIRGATSLTGNNQPLFVVDGVPISNGTFNSSSQGYGYPGYDYGSVVSDIAPSDIESVNVLKGAAATALYGARGANGVIIITTKSGKDDKDLGKNGLGVSISSNVTVGTIDKSTFPTYQNQYGAGYGPYYSGGGDGSAHPGLYYETLPWTNGQSVYVVPTTEDASFGTKFDPNLMVYQWDAFVPESPYYKQAKPWVAAANGPITFFNTAVSTTNTVAVNGVSDKGSFRLSYTNATQTGIMPNSKLAKNTVNLAVNHRLRKNLNVSANVTFMHQNAKGRNSTGYSDNILSSFRQWWEVNVDVKELKAMYDVAGKNVTWNQNYPEAGDLSPIYWNNFYWERYNNYETDSRDHLIGNVQAKWDATDYLSVTARVTMDTYTQLQEERKAIGSVAGAFGIGLPDVTSGYTRYTLQHTELNYTLMANFTKNLTEKLNLQAMIGTNLRRSYSQSLFASTNGGLKIAGMYSLTNSLFAPLTPVQGYNHIGVNSLYGSVSLGYSNMLYLDATLRGDMSSTLPVNNMMYLYPSVSGSFIFSNLMNADWLSFGKVRLNYAQVGNDAPFASLLDTYVFVDPFGSNNMYRLPNTKNNAELKSERTKSWETGLDLNFLKRRLNFSLTLYKTNTFNQILPVAISQATGYAFKYINAGNIQNEGIELTVNGTPVKTKNFNWNINVNWTANRNKVINLYESATDTIKNLQLNSYQGGVTVNARVGQPYGTIQGSDYVYLNGQKVVGSNGYYLVTSTTDNILGNYNPKWHLGITNTFTYKSWSAGFLIDIQHGGSVFSLDQYYGQGTGLYPNTVGNNDLGNPIRSAVTTGSNSGGVILPGVKADGSPNTTRVAADSYAGPFGWARNPAAAFVYDASYVKLREAHISYQFPKKLLKNTGIQGLSLGVVGTNLWIIHKNLPYADPEAGLGAGNTQGWQSGVMPTTRNIGFNLKVQF